MSLSFDTGISFCFLCSYFQMFQPVAIQSQDPPSLWALDVGVHKLSELQWMWGHWVTLGLVTHDMGNLENLGECLGKGLSYIQMLKLGGSDSDSLTA